MREIPWWRTKVEQEEIKHITDTILHEHLSQGEVTAEFEEKLAKLLNVRYVLATTSGSMALFLALLALGVGRDDEVIVPDRTFIATAHAAILAGAKVVLVDTLPDVPLIDCSLIRSKITSRTKAIIAVHINGRAVNMEEINQIAKEYGLFVVEDTCQALFSKNAAGFLGTQSDAGCFSLGVTKLITTGQGGLIVTRKKELYEKMKLMRTHGVLDTFDGVYDQFGFNFRFTDIAASIGIEQLLRIPRRIEHVNKIYTKYSSVMVRLPFSKMIPVNIDDGEIPLYAEVLCKKRDALKDFLVSYGISARPFTRNLNRSAYLGNTGDFPCSSIFEQKGLFLPSGVTQPLENIDYVIEVLSKFKS